MKLSDFDFHLPQNLIAQKPAIPRGSSRLLSCFCDGKITHGNFDDIIKVFQKNDVLVLNDTKVLPSLLYCYKQHNKDQIISINLVKKLQSNTWQILAKPAKKLNVGDVIYFSKNQSFSANVLYKDAIKNEIYIKFSLNKPKDSLIDYLNQYGKMPLPQYIKRNESLDQLDNLYYQTEYAKNIGSFAAPTAGLHFTQDLLKQIGEIGVHIEFITLHIGLGTFAPIKSENIEDHKMHTEQFSISTKTANIINNAKNNKSKIICVGTTTLRALESSASENSIVIPQKAKNTDIFIKPGYKFKVADSLITNFHLPKSSLFILLCAFTDIHLIKTLYSEAITAQYRFFSYGDACYIERFHK